MSAGDLRGAFDAGTARPRRGPRLLFWSLFVLLVGGAAWLLFAPRGHEAVPPEGVAGETPAAAAPNTHPVMLYFGDREARALVTERREVPSGASLEARVEATLLALGQGPDDPNAVPALPPQVHLNQVFYDDDSATLYVDYDVALLTRHPGGSAAEYFTLSAIVRTIGANFPEVMRVQILVDGQPVETLAGHFDTSKPIEIKSWQ